MKFTYPKELPISAAHDEIIDAVKCSQVVIVSGQTGSGKTTQIPKMLLEMGRGTHGPLWRYAASAHDRIVGSQPACGRNRAA